MKIKCLIIDDEPLARMRINSLLQELENVSCIGEAKTGKMAINMINELKPDLLFLDIQMKDLDGFEVLKKIKGKCPIIIFVTAFDEYAIKAFDHFAFDYLLKPFKKDRFITCVKRVEAHMKTTRRAEFNEQINQLVDYVNSANETQLHKIAVKTGKSVSFLETKKINYVLASGSYIELYWQDKKHVLRASLNNFLDEQLPPNFIRIHRSTVINIDYVEKLNHVSYGEIEVEMQDGKIFKVSESNKKELLRKLGIR